MANRTLSIFNIDNMYTHSIITPMTLNEYIKSYPSRERKEIRRLLAIELDNISEVYVRSMCNGHKAIPPKFAIRIEHFTGGLVSRQVTAPEYYPPDTNKEK